LHDTEHDFLLAIAAGDNDIRPVYADWLEERGDTMRADFLRVEESVHAMTFGDRAFDAALRRMRDLAGRVDPAWRTRVERPPPFIPFHVEFPKDRYLLDPVRGKSNGQWAIPDELGMLLERLDRLERGR
jgi:uncharacterized protein (TIGR02996 family)